MAKRLYLLRHAHSVYQSGTSDLERPLTPLGKKQAVALGAFMVGENFAPDIALCSNALRTRQTLDGIMQSLAPEDVRMLSILYSGTTGEYLEQIQACDDRVGSVLMIAHNPSIYGLVALLSKPQDAVMADRLSMGRYAPATLSILDVPQERWCDIQPRSCPLLDMTEPDDCS